MQELRIVRTSGVREKEVRFTNPQMVYDACRDMTTLDREHFVVLHLDGKNRIIARETVSIGSLNAAFEKGNFQEMKGTAHMLKSSADIFDSTLYKEKLVALESASKVGERDAIAKALKIINEVAIAWEAQLRDELEKLS